LGIYPGQIGLLEREFEGIDEFPGINSRVFVDGILKRAQISSSKIEKYFDNFDAVVKFDNINSNPTRDNINSNPTRDNINSNPTRDNINNKNNVDLIYTQDPPFPTKSIQGKITQYLP
jgi:hypothetical protein